jgi:DNA-directed RNA polymerase specialized sigma24 family protein
MSSEGSVTEWLGQLKAGDPAAARKLWENYFQKLVALARKRLKDTPRTAADEEDIALSALHSLCRGAERGKFGQLLDRNDLWQLLIVITARKIFDLQKRVQRENRAIPKVAGPRAEDWQSSAEGGWGLEQIIGQEPTPEFAAKVAEEWQRLLDVLGHETLRSVAIWKMEGHTNEEIAPLLGVVTRTVERKLRVIRGLWEKFMIHE